MPLRKPGVRLDEGGANVLSSEALADVLHSVATGFLDHALNIIATSDEIDDTERSVLWAALSGTNDRSGKARRLGDALRALGAPRPLVNEAYRSAFYSSEEWKSLAANPLFAYFVANRGGTPLDKWTHYFPIYDRHLACFRGTPAHVLEIGVYRGGGLDMLRQYFGTDANLVGIDIDPSVVAALAGRHPVEVGDQEDPDFLLRVAARYGPFDVIIDDGGHTMRQQIASVETLFPHLADGGVYLVEDCHTSYWAEFADSSEPGRTLVAWIKDRIDDLHAYHHSVEPVLTYPWQTDLLAVHAYDSVIVLDKERRSPPFSDVSGTNDYINVGRDAGNANVALIATREAALQSATETESRIAEASDELRILRGELMAANQNLGRLRADLDSTQEELDDTNAKLFGSWGIIQEMRQSRSWRLTAPIRRVKSVIRRQ